MIVFQVVFGVFGRVSPVTGVGVESSLSSHGGGHEAARSQRDGGGHESDYATGDARTGALAGLGRGIAGSEVGCGRTWALDVVERSDVGCCEARSSEKECAPEWSVPWFGQWKDSRGLGCVSAFVRC